MILINAIKASRSQAGLPSKTEKVFPLTSQSWDKGGIAIWFGGDSGEEKIDVDKIPISFICSEHSSVPLAPSGIVRKDDSSKKC